MEETVSDIEDTDSPVEWSKPKQEVREVTDKQLHDFNETFKEKSNYFAELKQIRQSLASERASLEKEYQNLVNQDKQLKIEKKKYEETSIELQKIKSNTKPVKKRGIDKNDISIQEEMLKVRITEKSIADLSKKKNVLEAQLKEEATKWGIEKSRLTQKIKILDIENEEMKNAIEQFNSYIELNDKDSIEPIIDEPSAFTHFQNSSSTMATPVEPSTPRRESASPKSPSTPSTPKSPSFNSQITNAYLASPIRKLVKKVDEAQKPQFIIPASDELLFPIVDLDFQYYPTSKGITSKDGKKVNYENGDALIKLRSGIQKIKTSSVTFIYYPNGDAAKTFVNGINVYRYAETNAIEVKLPNDIRHIVFQNKQREVHFPNGDKYIVYANKITKYSKPNGDYQICTPDGKTETYMNGEKI